MPDNLPSNYASNSARSSETPRELTWSQWWQILFSSAFVPVLSIAVMWALYLSLHFFKFDIVAMLKRRRQPGMRDILEQETPTFYIAIGGTIIALAYALYYFLLARKLAREGVEVIAEVSKAGGLSIMGLTRIYYQYPHEGRLIRKLTSCLADQAEAYIGGHDQLIVIYDPRKPKRSMFKHDVFGVRDSGDSEKLRQARMAERLDNYPEVIED